MSSIYPTSNQLYLLLRDGASNRRCREALLALRNIPLNEDYLRVVGDFVSRHPSTRVVIEAMQLLADLFPSAKLTYQTLFRKAAQYDGKLRKAALSLLRELLLKWQRPQPGATLFLRLRYARDLLPEMLCSLENAGTYLHYETWRARRGRRRQKKAWEPVFQFVRDLVDFLGEHATEPLFLVVATRSLDSSRWAARALGRVGGDELLKLLPNILTKWEHGGPEMEKSMVYLIGRMGPAAMEALPKLYDRYFYLQRKGTVDQAALVLMAIARVGCHEPETVRFLCKEFVRVHSNSADDVSDGGPGCWWLRKPVMLRHIMNALSVLGSNALPALPLLLAYLPEAHNSLRKLTFVVLEKMGFPNEDVRGAVGAKLLSQRGWNATTAAQVLHSSAVVPDLYTFWEGFQAWEGYKNLMERTKQALPQSSFTEGTELDWLPKGSPIAMWQTQLSELFSYLEQELDGRTQALEERYPSWEDVLFVPPALEGTSVCRG
ncbi:MAG: hypothetical protein EP343_26765 [Deltaproteobacteria bacterium]|nr:MAG: hypothetical protein EP343_26765 [Deltaproteobacteria bacterium]